MNSYELTKQIDFFLSEIKDNHYIDGINILSEIFDKISNVFEKVIVATDNQKIISTVNSTKNVLNQTIELEKDQIDIFKFYEDGIKLNESLKALTELISAENEDVFFILSDSINNSINLYNEHVRNYNHLTLYLLCKEARTIRASINAIVNSYSPLKKSLLGDDDEFQLVIVFGDISEANKLAFKLQSIQKAYDEICHYCSIEINEYPLTIIKLEMGSPWYIKLSGHPAVIAILTSTLTLGAMFVQEKYITSSEIEEIPKIAKAANEVLKLTESLKKGGFEVNNQLDELNKLSVKLSKQLNNLVIDQANIEINGNVHSIPNIQVKNFLNETKKLEHNSVEH